MTYWYISGQMGMRANGSFTRNRNHWITFDTCEVEKLIGKRPYGATKTGSFVTSRT